MKYAGCNLTVIDSCNDDSVRGVYGSYKPIEWTSGAVEKVDIENSADLYAKLPLGASLLGGRVESGEKFHMEYFVTGTRSATRPAIYSADLAKNPGCNGVTHFVFGYNLGAFALGSRANIKASANATIWGAGAGADTRSQSAIDKKGEISACTAESAKELDGCKVPIRLTLRAIADGASPNAIAAQAPDTPGAMNLAGQLQARTDADRQAQEHMSAAFTAATEEPPIAIGSRARCMCSVARTKRTRRPNAVMRSTWLIASSTTCKPATTATWRTTRITR